jgi:tetratricopeptide (TPR) repeat protein
MKNLSEIFLNKITLCLEEFFSKSQVTELIQGFETQRFPNNQSPAALSESTFLTELDYNSIEERKIIDGTITFAKKTLEKDSYSKFLLELAKVLAENDNMNMAAEILVNSIQKVQSDSFYAESSLALADIFIRKAYWDNSLTLINQAKVIYTRLGDKLGLARCENLFGTSYGERGVLQISKDHFKNGLDLLQDNLNVKLSAEIETNLAILENISGNFSVAELHIFSALHKFEILGDTKRIAEVRHNIGMLFLEQKEYVKANIEFDKAIAIATAENYQTLLSVSFLGKAETLLRCDDYKNSLAYCYNALDIANKIEDKLTIADVYRVIGMLERKQKNYKLSEKYLQISLSLNEELNRNGI